MKKLWYKIIVTLLMMTIFCSSVFAAESKPLKLVLPSDYFSFGFYSNSTATSSMDSLTLSYDSSSVNLSSKVFYASGNFYVKWTTASRSRIKITMNVSEWTPNAYGDGKISFVAKTNSDTTLTSLFSGDIVIDDIASGSVVSGIVGYTATVSMDGVQSGKSYSSTVVLKVEVQE